MEAERLVGRDIRPRPEKRQEFAEYIISFMWTNLCHPEQEIFRVQYRNLLHVLRIPAPSQFYNMLERTQCVEANADNSITFRVKLRCYEAVGNPGPTVPVALVFREANPDCFELDN